MQWQGRNIGELNSLEVIQAYHVCLSQEKRREQAAKHDKFNKDAIDPVSGEVKTPKMEFPHPNPHFLAVKKALLEEITKRKLQISE